MRNFKALPLFIIFFTFSAFSQNSGRIAGRIVFAGDASPVAGATVQIVQLGRTTIADDQGKYEFTNIPAGRYTIAAHRDGFGDVARSIVIAGGAASTVDFKLQVSGIREQVTVTATGEKEAAFDSISPTISVDSTRIMERGSIALGDVLDRQPGVAKRTATAATARPVIRGFDGDRILVAEDGIRDGSIAAFSENHPEPVDTLSADRIEVVRGPATLLYGSNAIGGVVNAIGRNEDNFHKGLSGYLLGIGAVNNKQIATSGGLDYGYKNWMAWFSGTAQRTGDYKAGGDFGTVENTATRHGYGAGGFGYFGEKGFFRANYSYHQELIGIPIDFEEDPPREEHIRSYRSNYRINGGFRDLNSFIEGAKFTFDYSNYRQRESGFLLDESDAEEESVTFRNKLMSYRGVFDQRKYGKLTGTFGLDGYRRDYSSEGEEVLFHGKVVQNSFSLFALEQLSFERVTLQFGGRLENNHYRPTDPSLPKRDLTGFSGSVGTRFALWNGGAFVANYSHASRLPDLEEFYNNGPHDDTQSFEVGDPNLKVEKSDGIDISLRHQKGRFNAEATFFYYNIRNFVFLEPTDIIDEDTGLPFAFFVQGDSRFIGTELSLDVRTTKWLDLFAGMDYVNAELKDGTPLPRIPPLRGRFGLDAHYKNLTVRPEFIAVADQNRVFTNETRTPGYGVFDITGSYVIPGKRYTHIFSASGVNLTDKLYFNHISFIKDISPEIGRNFRFSYTIRFY